MGTTIVDILYKGGETMGTNKFHWEMGARIAHRRKAVGLTQEQLAEQMNVSTQTISYIETGHKAIRPENLAKLCQVLQVSADYILLGHVAPAETNRTAVKLSSLNAIELQLVESIIDNCLQLAGKGDQKA